MTNGNKIIYAYDIRVNVYSDDYGFDTIDVIILSDAGRAIHYYSIHSYDMKDIRGGYLFWFRLHSLSKIVYVFIPEYIIWR